MSRSNKWWSVLFVLMDIMNLMEDVNLVKKIVNIVKNQMENVTLVKKAIV